MSDLREAAQQALEALEADDSKLWPSDKRIAAIAALKAALAEPVQEQDIEDAVEAAYWHFDARKKGLNEWASAPQSERDAFKAEARKLVKGYFPTRQAQDTKREMLAVADAFIRGKRAALAEPDEPVAWINAARDVLTSHPESWGRECEGWTPLYTHPAPQRQPLTDEQIKAAALSVPASVYELMHGHEITVEQFQTALADFARAIEAAHGITGEQK